MRNRWMVVALIATVVLATVVTAQQTRQTETGTVTADEFEWDFANNDFKATGNVTINIEGRHRAQLTAPAVSLDMDDSMNQIMRAVAVGPVRLDLLTAPDSKGLQRRVIASCGGRATYDGKTQIVTMTGGAEADVTTLPETNVEAAHFTGASITVDLANSKLSAKQMELSVTTEVEIEKDE